MNIPEDNNLKEAKLVVDCAEQMSLEIKCSKEKAIRVIAGQMNKGEI